MVHLEGAYLRAAHLNSADVREALLAGVNLFSAHLEGASQVNARLEGAALHATDLHQGPQGTQGAAASLPPANLREVFFDSGTFLRGVKLGDNSGGFVSLADIHWGNANIAVMNWQTVSVLGDERLARQRKSKSQPRCPPDDV
jgi:uncharacterized protein YjbI with pentapeptide repeats